MDDDYKKALDRQKAWVSDDELASLHLERRTGFGTIDGKPESPTDQAVRIMRENAPAAAQTLVKLALNGETEQVRLKASVEILNRAAAAGTGSDGRDPWANLYEDTLVETPTKTNGGRK
jgi:hypothetical protein